MVNNGFNRAQAYQIVYGLSNDDAKELENLDTYNNLISCGLPAEMARSIAYKTENDNFKTR